jgi:hypothetical protein
MEFNAYTENMKKENCNSLLGINLKTDVLSSRNSYNWIPYRLEFAVRFKKYKTQTYSISWSFPHKKS